MSVIKTDLPIADPDMKWDKGEAVKAVKSWASDDDGNIDFKKYRKAFFFVDDDNDEDDNGGEKQGDYHLPFATIVDGSLKAVWSGVEAAMGALNGARGGFDLGDESDEKESLYKQICVYYKKFDKDCPDMKALTREVGERVDIMAHFEASTVKDMGDGVFEATITTAEIDRTGEVIDTNGITTDGWVKTGMPVLYGHDYQSLPIGKGLSFRQMKSKMTAKFQLAIKEYPFAATVADMIKGGYLNAVSIGGVVKEWSEDYLTIKALDMVEFSVVPIPANASAIITSRALEDMTGKSVKEISREYHEFLEKAIANKVKDLDNAELMRHIQSLKTLTAILELTMASKTSEKDTSENDEKVTFTLKRTAGKISNTGQEIIKLVKAKG